MISLKWIDNNEKKRTENRNHLSWDHLVAVQTVVYQMCVIEFVFFFWFFPVDEMKKIRNLFAIAIAILVCQDHRLSGQSIDGEPMDPMNTTESSADRKMFDCFKWTFDLFNFFLIFRCISNSNDIGRHCSDSNWHCPIWSLASN